MHSVVRIDVYLLQIESIIDLHVHLL